MTNADILDAIETRKSQTKGPLNAWILLIVSASLFAGTGAFHWDVQFVALLAVAIFIHELGHLLAMKLFRYKNLKMLFIPFVGGAASGEPDEHNAYKIAMISIFGPFIGFISCYVAVVLWLLTKEEVFVEYAYLSVFLNAFNLLPILPLDGGHFLNETLFNRYPLTELVFRILAILGLGVLAYAFQSWLLGGLAFIMLLSLGVSHKMAVAASVLRKEEDLKGGDLTEEKVERIREEILRANPQFEKNPKALVNAVKDTWLKVNKTFPGMGTTVLLLFAYVAIFFGLPMVTAGVIYVASRPPQLQASVFPAPTAVDHPASQAMSITNIAEATNAPLVRTDFSDDRGWQAICAAVRKATPEDQEAFNALVAANSAMGQDIGKAGELPPFVDAVENPQFAGLTIDELLALIAEESNHGRLYVVDRFSISHPEHPIRVVDVHGRRGRTFRAVPSQIYGIEANLSTSNMEWEAFTEHLEEDGIFRGFSK